MLYLHKWTHVLKVWISRVLNFLGFLQMGEKTKNQNEGQKLCIFLFGLRYNWITFVIIITTLLYILYLLHFLE